MVNKCVKFWPYNNVMVHCVVNWLLIIILSSCFHLPQSLIFSTVSDGVD